MLPLFRVQPDETPGHLLDLCLGMRGGTEMGCIAARESIVRIDGDNEPGEFQLATRPVDGNGTPKIVERVPVRLNGDPVDPAQGVVVAEVRHSISPWRTSHRGPRASVPCRKTRRRTRLL